MNCLCWNDKTKQSCEREGVARLSSRVMVRGQWKRIETTWCKRHVQRGRRAHAALYVNVREEVA